MITLSRNTPVAFVVGCAGFLGSNLVEKLLQKNIQVIGLDNLSTGRKEYLAEGIKDKNFHLLVTDAASKFDETFPRLDYAFFVLAEDTPDYIYRQAFTNFLKICEQFKPKTVLVSSVDLYDNHSSHPPTLKEAEKELAHFSGENKLNARIVRLEQLYGPRMHFRNDNPVNRLIKAAFVGDLQKESTPLDFTTRNLYIDDAVDLLIKAVMHGSTAQKIYDGALSSPVKVAEIRQILLDPLWYENRNFQPTELPPWPTPNLVKTEKELAWKPKTSLVKALKQTIHFFKENPDLLKVEEVKPEPIKEEKIIIEEKPKEEVKEKKQNTKNIRWGSYTQILLVLGLISYALIYPLCALAVGVFSFNLHLQEGQKAVLAGNFTQAEAELVQLESAAGGVGEMKQIFSSLGLKDTVALLEQVDQLNQALKHEVNGLKNLTQGIKVLLGEQEGDGKDLFIQAFTGLDQADKNLKESSFVLNNINLPLADSAVADLKKAMGEQQQNIIGGKGLALVLPKLAPLDAKKSYLILLVDNSSLRGGGGVIQALTQVDFDKGKLGKITTENIKITQDIKDEMDEADFASNARRLQWFYSKAGGDQVAGVISLDTTVLTELSAKDLDEALKKLLFTTDKTLLTRIQTISKLANEKHILFYFTDSELLSQAVSGGWAGVMPRQTRETKGEREEFISLVETDFHGSRGGTNLKKDINVVTTIDKNNEVTHKLTVNYENSGEKLESKMKFYFPGGTKLNKAQLGGKDVFDKVSSFTDFGRAGYSLPVIFLPGEKTQLVLDYKDGKPLEFIDNQLKWEMNIIKQAGTGKNQFVYKLIYPSHLRLDSSQSVSIPGEVIFQTDLSRDRSLELLLATN